MGGTTSDLAQGVDAGQRDRRHTDNGENVTSVQEEETAANWGILERLSDWGLVQRRAGADLYDDKKTDEDLRNHNNNVRKKTASNVNLNTRREDGQTPLTILLRANDVKAAMDLLQHPGIDLSYPEKQQYSLYSYVEVPPLIVATKTGNTELVKMLLDAGASVNTTDSSSCSALYYATESGDRDMFSLLLEYKPELTSLPDVDDPLHQACRHGHLDMVKMLVSKGCDLNPKKATELMSPLQLAIQYQHQDICLYILNHGADHSCKGNSTVQPFLRACWYGCPRVVQYFIDAGVDVNMTSDNSTSGIVYALRPGDLSRIGRESRVCNANELKSVEANFREVLRESISVIELLCDSGCDIELRTGVSNLSPLCLSLKACNIPAAIVLLKHGAVWDSSCDYLFETRNIKSLQKKNAAVFETLLRFLNNKRRNMNKQRDNFNNVPTLKDCCRRRVRTCLQNNRTLTTSIIPSARTLVLPKLLKEFLCYSEIDDNVLISNIPISMAY